jgi:hypothetical protein
MKKFIITIAALASLSTVSFAGDRTDVDPRDRAFGDINIAASAFNRGSPVTNSVAFAVSGIEAGSSMSAFKRLTRQSIQNENSRNNN